MDLSTIVDGHLRARVRVGSETNSAIAPLVPSVTQNLHRRHLNESQRGMVGAMIANLQQGGPRGNQHTGGKSAIAPLANPVTQKSAAEMLNIGVDSIKRSKTVMRDGL